MKPITHIFIFPAVMFLCVTIYLLFFQQQSYTSKIFAVSQSLLISEIQLSGTTSDDEFVELYNPTALPVDLTGWRLARKTSATSSGILNLVSSMSGLLQPHHYFLIANPHFSNVSTPADMWYSATSSALAANNTVILFSDSGTSIVDKVGMGTANDKEQNTIPNPGTGQSIERKANSLATNTTMQIGGTDEFNGNGFDTDDNESDFILRAIPQPQNQANPEEPTVVPSPTLSITPTLTNTPTGTQPTTTPAQPPLPTTPVPSTPTVTPIPTPSPFPFPRIILSCSTTLRHIKTPWKTFSFPILTCKLQTRL